MEETRGRPMLHQEPTGLAVLVALEIAPHQLFNHSLKRRVQWCSSFREPVICVSDEAKSLAHW